MSFNQTKTYKELIDLIKINEFDKIKKILDSNKEQYQNDAGFFSFLGYFNEYLNNFLDAEKNYLNAIKLEENNFDAKLNLAILYLKLKKYNGLRLLRKKQRAIARKQQKLIKPVQLPLDL